MRSLGDGSADFREVAYKPNNKPKFWIRSYNGTQGHPSGAPGDNTGAEPTEPSPRGERHHQLRSVMVYVYPENLGGKGYMAIRKYPVCIVRNITQPTIASIVAEAELRNSSQSSTVTTNSDVTILRATSPNCDLLTLNPAIGMLCRRFSVPHDTEVLEEEPTTLEAGEVKATVTTFNGKVILIYNSERSETSCRGGRRGQGRRRGGRRGGRRRGNRGGAGGNRGGRPGRRPAGRPNRRG